MYGLSKKMFFIYEVAHQLFNSRSMPSKASHKFGSPTTKMHVSLIKSLMLCIVTYKNIETPFCFIC